MTNARSATTRSAERRLTGSAGAIRVAIYVVLASCMVLASMGCGGAHRPARPAPLTPAVHRYPLERAEVLIVPRPTRERFWLSVWLKHATPAAHPPQLAVGMSWLAEQRLPGFESLVTPHGVQFAGSCVRGEEPACIAQIARAWSEPVSPGELSTLRAHLRAERQRRRADATVVLDQMALSALLGGSVSPLGVAQDDEAVTALGLAAWMEAQRRRSPLLVMAVGDVRAEELARTAAELLPLPRPDRSERSGRGVLRGPAAPARSPNEGVSPGSAVRVALGHGSEAVATAQLCSGVAAAKLASKRILAQLRRRGVAAQSEVFPLAGRTAVVVRATGGAATPELLAQAARRAGRPPLSGLPRSMIHDLSRRRAGGVHPPSARPLVEDTSASPPPGRTSIGPIALGPTRSELANHAPRAGSTVSGSALAGSPMARVAGGPRFLSLTAGCASEEPSVLTRYAGARWAAGGDRTPGDRGQRGCDLRLGVGVMARSGGRGAKGREAIALERTWRRRVNATLAAPEVAREVSSQGGHTTTPNGVRLRARRLPGAARVAVIAHVSGGSAEEEAWNHGETRLIASTLERGCVRTAREELGFALEGLGIDIESYAGPAGFGLSVSGPRSAWRLVSYLAAECLQVPRWDAFSEAQLAASNALFHPVARVVGALAITLQPDAPGLLVPAGRADSVAAITKRTLMRRSRERWAGANLLISVVGDLSAVDVIRELTWSWRSWPRAAGRRRPPIAPRPEPPKTYVEVVASPDDSVYWALGWSIASTDDLGLAAFGSAFAEALERTGRVEVQRTLHGCAEGTCALGLVAKSTATPVASPLQLVLAAQRAVRPNVKALAATALARAEERRRWSASSSMRLARGLAEREELPGEAQIASRLLTLATQRAWVLVAQPEAER